MSAVIGLYTLKEDLHLATPPPHPSEAPVVNPNPLSTAPQPATAGTKISLVGLDVQPPPPAFYKATPRPGGVQQSIQEHPNESKSSSSLRQSDDGPVLVSHAPAFGEGNVLLAPPVTKDSNKRRKPKNNMAKTNSSFISRVIVSDTLNKRLADRPTGGIFAFANINRAFQWLDLSSPSKVAQRPLETHQKRSANCV